MNTKENVFREFVLYSYWRSSSSWRIRIVMNLKKIPYQIKPVHLVKKDNLSEEFRKINPIQKIPVLEFKSFNNQNELYNLNEGEINYLAESMAICEFLEENFNEVKLLPYDTILRAKVRSFCLEIACNIQPLQNLPILNKIKEIGYDMTLWAKEIITKGLIIVEEILQLNFENFEKSEGKLSKFCFGDNITLADAFLIPQLYNARRFGVDLNEENFKNILRVENNCKEIEAFIQGHPDNQPDYEANK